MSGNNVMLGILVALGLVLVLMSGYGIALVSNQENVDYDKIGAMVDSKLSSLPTPVAPPTAAEIAALVVVPASEDVDNDKVNDLWEDLYGEEIAALEGNATEAVLEELDDDDSLDEIIEMLAAAGIVVDDEDDVEIDVDDDETEVEIVRLGVDDEDDGQEAVVTLEIKVSYSIEGESDTVHKHMIVTGVYTGDEDGDEDTELTFSFK
jgi:hypothetical protein